MERELYFSRIDSAFSVHPVVAMLGPRQCGKTTTARQYFAIRDIPVPQTHYFDLERTDDLARLENPFLTLSRLEGLIIIDEIQRVPNLFSALRVLVDEPGHNRRFLILGSASRELIRQSSESLAGRIEYIELTPFSLDELLDEDSDPVNDLWLRGGFPRSFLAGSDEQSAQWRRAYIKTYLEQDIPNLGIRIAPVMLHRLWMMLTHYHGNIIHYAELGRSFGIDIKTVQYYVGILVSTFMIRQLQPWHENLSKRQIKSHKIYFRDSGILHSLKAIETMDDLLVDPKMGASWEGFAIEEMIRLYQAKGFESYFWATQGGAELDLFMIKGNKRLGFECKYTDAPKLTKSMVIAMNDLKLTQLKVLYPGTKKYALADNIEAVPLTDVLKEFDDTQ